MPTLNTPSSSSPKSKSKSLSLYMGCISPKISQQLKDQRIKFKASDAAYWQRVADALSILGVGQYLTDKQQQQGRQKLVKRITSDLSKYNKQ